MDFTVRQVYLFCGIVFLYGGLLFSEPLPLETFDGIRFDVLLPRVNTNAPHVIGVERATTLPVPVSMPPHLQSVVPYTPPSCFKIQAGPSFDDTIFEQSIRYDSQKYIERSYFAMCGVKDFAAEFNHLDIAEVYGHYDLYRFNDFRTYCAARGDFDSYLVALHNKIVNDHGFRKKTRAVDGFESSFSLFKNKSGFHEWVAQQAQDIEQKRAVAKQKTVVAEREWVLTAAGIIRDERDAYAAHREQWCHDDLRNDVGQEDCNVDALLEEVAYAHDYFKTRLALAHLTDEERSWYELGMLCVERAYDAQADELDEQMLRHAQRASAMVQDSQYKHDRYVDYPLQEAVCLSLYNQEIVPATFTQFCGDATQQVVHAELIRTINNTVCMEQAFSNDLQIAGLSALVYRMCDIAAACNQQDYPLERRFLLSDVCDGMLDMTRTVAHSVGSGTGCSRSAVAFSETLLGSAFITARNDLIGIAQAVVKNPLPMFAGIGVSAVMPPAYLMAGLLVLGAANHQELCAWATGCLRDFKQNPEQAIGKTIGSLMSMLVVGSVTNVAGKGTTVAAKTLTKHLPALEQLLVNEQRLASLLGQCKDAVTHTITPIKTMFMQGVESIRAIAQGATGKRLNKDHIKLVESVWAWSEKQTKELLCKIRNVSDDFVNVMEKSGAHTIERHASQATNALIQRAKILPDAATSFFDESAARRAVQENLRINALKIVRWLQCERGNAKAFVCVHNSFIGHGVKSGKTVVVNNLIKSKMVLERSSTSPLGFIVLTAFPII